MKHASRSDRRRVILPLSVLGLLGSVVSGLAIAWIGNSCAGECLQIGDQILPVAGVALTLNLSIGVFAIIDAGSQHDWQAMSSLGIVTGLGLLASYIFLFGSSLYHHVDPVWSQVGAYGMLVLFVLPPLAAFMYGLARTRLIQALTVVGLIAALTVLNAMLL